MTAIEQGSLIPHTNMANTLRTPHVKTVLTCLADARHLMGTRHRAGTGGCLRVHLHAQYGVRGGFLAISYSQVVCTLRSRAPKKEYAAMIT